MDENVYELKGQIKAYEFVINTLISHLKIEDINSLVNTLKNRSDELKEKPKETRENSDVIGKQIIHEIKRKVKKKSEQRKSRSISKIDEYEKRIKEKKRNKINSLFDLNEEDCEKIYNFYSKNKDKIKKQNYQIMIDVKYKLLKYNTTFDYYKKMCNLQKIYNSDLLDIFDKKWMLEENSEDFLNKTIDDKIIEKYKIGFELSFDCILKYHSNIFSKFCKNFNFPILFYFCIKDILNSFDIPFNHFFIYYDNSFYYLEEIDHENNSEIYIKHNSIEFINYFIENIVDFLCSYYNNILRKIYNHNEISNEFKFLKNNSIEFKQILLNLYYLTSSEFTNYFKEIIITKCHMNCLKNNQRFIENPGDIISNKYTFNCVLEMIFSNYKKEIHYDALLTQIHN